MFPARAALNVSISYSRRLRFNSLFESGFRWRLFRDLNPYYFSQRYRVLYRVDFHNRLNKEPFQSTLLSIIRNGFTAVVSLYFKCALKCDIAFSLSRRLASFVISAISHTHWCRAFNLQLAIFTNGIFTSVFLSKLSKIQNRLMMSAFLYTCKAQVSSCMPLL